MLDIAMAVAKPHFLEYTLYSEHLSQMKACKTQKVIHL